MDGSTKRRFGRRKRSDNLKNRIATSTQTVEVSKIPIIDKSSIEDVANLLLVSSGFDPSGNKVECEHHDRCFAAVGSKLNCNNKCYILDNWNSLSQNELELLKIGSKEGTIHATCPRSSHKVCIGRKCSNADCYFYNEKMSYFCIVLHNQIFFQSNYDIQKSVVEIALDSNKNAISKGVKVAIYMLRMYFLLHKYLLETKEESSSEVDNYVVSNLLQLDNSREICSICGNTYSYLSGNCNCLHDSSVRKKRISFQEKWRNLIQQEEESYSMDSLLPQEFIHKYSSSLNDKRFICYLLSTINIDGVFLKDVPLGFLIKSYIDVFGSIDLLNFGLDDTLGSKMLSIFDTK